MSIEEQKLHDNTTIFHFMTCKLILKSVIFLYCMYKIPNTFKLELFLRKKIYRVRWDLKQTKTLNTSFIDNITVLN